MTMIAAGRDHAEGVAGEVQTPPPSRDDGTHRRATRLELTPAGQAVLDELVAVRSAALAEVTRHLEPSERRALLAGARAFTRARERHLPGAR
jgi:hypothetical protein